MELKGILRQINGELGSCFERLQENQLKTLETAIRDANRIFVAGAGRSLLMIRGLAMRLMHLGYTAYVVGETVTPAIQKGDLLVIASGSGSTGTLCVVAERCKGVGASLALITTIHESKIGQLADVIVHVDAATTKHLAGASTTISIQPGANVFEQAVLLISDAIVTDLSGDASINDINEALMGRHANLE